MLTSSDLSTPILSRRAGSTHCQGCFSCYALPPFFNATSLNPFTYLANLIGLLPARASEQGKVIGVGVHSYICLWTKKKFKSYFSGRLTFSNIRGRTSRRIYRLYLLVLMRVWISVIWQISKGLRK